MKRALSIAFNVMLLGLASGLVSPLSPTRQGLGLSTEIENLDFLPTSYSLGAHSHLLVKSLSGDELRSESLRFEAWDCRLEFGTPGDAYVEWIHQVDLLCSSGTDTVIFPLGEGEFRKAYSKGRLLVKGEVAESLFAALVPHANASSVESPVSSRIINWGPINRMHILTLRRSAVEANLKFSVECYEDYQTHSIHSCAISF